MKTVTFLKSFSFIHKLPRKEAWKHTLTRYKAGVEYTVRDEVIAVAIEKGALPAPITATEGSDPEGE